MATRDPWCGLITSSAFAGGSARSGLLRPARTITTIAVVGWSAAHLFAVAASAQQATPAPARQAAASKPAAKPAAKSDTAPATTEGGLRQRVEQLEEQLVEMQVTVGTLDSLAKGGGSSSSGVYRGNSAESGGGASGADAGRIAVLETQVRALATQVDQLTQALRQANARPAASPLSAPAVLAAPGLAVPIAGPTPLAAAAPDASDPIGRLVNNGRVGSPAPPLASAAAPAASFPVAAASDASSKEAYESAYGYLLQQDFASAEAAFDDFLKRFPNDPLAGNAQYWLGETFFARGQYKPAAGAFLKGYQTYGRSAKAPDSVLKLALSLDKLGQKDAACASYAELTTKFPNAPGHVKNRADTERHRLGCS